MDPEHYDGCGLRNTDTEPECKPGNTDADTDSDTWYTYPNAYGERVTFSVTRRLFVRQRRA